MRSIREQNLQTYVQRDAQALKYMLPSKYILDREQYTIHVVLFAQLRAAATDPQNQRIGSYTRSEYYVPCLPVKYLDVYKLNTDFQKNLTVQYYDKNLPGQLYRMSDIEDVIPERTPPQVRELTQVRCTFRAACSIYEYE